MEGSPLTLSLFRITAEEEVESGAVPVVVFFLPLGDWFGVE